MFGSKSKNRRLERKSVLDVKLRSQQARLLRLKFAARILGRLAFAAALAAGAWFGTQWTLDRYVYRNEVFLVRGLDVQTDGVLTVPEVFQWSGLKPGANLLALDLGRIKRDLELVPMIESAAVERILPGTLRVHLKERKPVARIVGFSRDIERGRLLAVDFQLDRKGFVMLPIPSHARRVPVSQLPLISGISGTELRPGALIEVARVRAALQLIEMFRSSPMVGVVDIEKIDVSIAHALWVTTADGSRVTFGLSGFDQQLRRWRSVHELGLKTGRSIATLDLSVANHVPVTWLEPRGSAKVEPTVSVNSRKTTHV